jgi:diguanylate cyclase (GGDEF)-like protein/putative nucleotidyltransferase with HDIG domain
MARRLYRFLRRFHPIGGDTKTKSIGELINHISRPNFLSAHRKISGKVLIFRELPMKKLKLSEYGWRMKSLWCAMLGLNLFALGFAFYELSSSAAQLAVLCVSLVISGIICQHTIKIPKTTAKISTKELMIFWAIIWLGAPGAVLVALSASLAMFDFNGKDIKQQLFRIFASVGATLAAAEVFYLFLHYSVNFSGRALADRQIAASTFIVAVGLTAVTHYFLNSFVYSVFRKIENDYTFRQIWNDYFMWAAGVYTLGTAAAFTLHYVFAYFGVAFGLVLLPFAIAGHLGYRIHERRLAQKTSEITEASRIHLATVEALATAIDARDQVGVGHVRRTQIYAMGMGKNLGLSEEEIDALRTGALLHDIGKLAVPDHILNKPGRLSPAETEKIKIHSVVGASILEKVGFSCPVVPTVKYHHEMWDGSGYPEGLQGEEIPLTARILAVADSYDSLRGARPYRPAVSRDEARRYLLSNAGTQFDPKIVDVFLRNLRRFEIEIEQEEGFSYIFDENAQHIHGSEASGDSYVEQIKRANREVFTLYELARVFSSSLNLDETLSLFARKISDFVSFDTCAIYLLDETRKNARAIYCEGKNHVALKNKRIGVGEGATGYVLSTRQPVQNINPALDFSALPFGQEYTAMASLPLIADDKLIGAVSLYSCELLGYQEEHLRLLDTVSRIAADAICKSIQHTETETRALTDPMTGLPNARSLQMQFEKEVARSSRSGSGFQVLMLDLDGFKAVNDTYGHKAGDKLLKGLAAAMSEQLRDYDFLARYAGDEFVALVPETDADAVRDLCARIEKAVIGFKLPVGEGEFARVGVSLGAASYPQSGETFDQVLIAADKAMYAVKAIRKRKQSESAKQHQQPPVQLAVQPTANIQVTQNQMIPAENQLHKISEKDFVPHVSEDIFIVELDESHIISSAVN